MDAKLQFYNRHYFLLFDPNFCQNIFLLLLEEVLCGLYKPVLVWEVNKKNHSYNTLRYKNQYTNQHEMKEKQKETRKSHVLGWCFQWAI